MNILVEKSIMAPMRDGVRLATDIYRDAEGVPAPTLVMRMPYDKERFASPEVFAFVRAGYAVVLQDTRGRFASEGEFNPNFQEIEDSADCYAWVAQQPWCDGRIGTTGSSYLGQLQWLSAPQMPEQVRAMSVLIAPIDHYSDIAYRGGALNLGSMLFWCSMMAIGEQARRAASGRATAGDIAAQAQALAELEARYHDLPLAEMPHLRGVFPPFFSWLAHPSYDDYWRAIDARRGVPQLDRPTLHIGGWYDIFLNGTLQSFTLMRAHARTPEARMRQKLVVGPWSHGTNWTSSYHEREFGMHASGDAANLTGLQLRWMDRWVRGIENGVEHEPPVRIFVMGADVWRDLEDWPPPDMVLSPFYLRSGGRANTLHGDGALAAEAPGAEPPDSVCSDPQNPVPSVGGANLTPFASTIGPRDQRQVELREDVLVFSTPALERDLTVIGPVEAILYVSSTAPDTDIACKLVDVDPEGRAMLIADGILRLRYRESVERPRLMRPGEIVEARVDLWSTANVFRAGHRVRIEVAGSCFPKFARNSNTGGDIATERAEQYQAATIWVHHDADHPSRILLPLVERG